MLDLTTLKKRKNQDFKTKISFVLVCLTLFSCASRKYSDEERIKNNSFTVTSNVAGAFITIKSEKHKNKEMFFPTSSSDGKGNFSVRNSYKKLKFPRLSLVVSKENYESETIHVWRVPRGKPLAKDILLGIITYGVPVIYDAFRSDFYKVAPWSRNIYVNLKFTQEFMEKEFRKIENSTKPEPFVVYISTYPYSDFYNKAIDKKDSTELLVALDKSLESAIDEYISSHQKSKFLVEAKKIKNGIVEAREKFEIAKSKNTVEAYEEYINSYPKSLQKREAINSLLNISFKTTVTKNKLDDMLSYNKYLMKYQIYLIEDSAKIKTERITKLIDKQIIKECDTDPKNKYSSYSRLWKKYIEVSTNNKNITGLEQTEAYLPKICNLLLTELVKHKDEKTQLSFLNQCEKDFQNLTRFGIITDKPTPFINALIDNSTGFTGLIKLYNQKYYQNRMDDTWEGDALKSLVGFEYKGNYNENYYQNATIEEYTFKNGEITNVKLYNDINLLATGTFNGKESSECSFFINGQLVRTNYATRKTYYFYEFENGTNLSLKNLEMKIKEADYELSNKNFDRAIELYTTNCANDYPKSIPLNVRIDKSIQNAKNLKVAYLQKVEQDRIAEERRKEQDKINMWKAKTTFSQEDKNNLYNEYLAAKEKGSYDIAISLLTIYLNKCNDDDKYKGVSYRERAELYMMKSDYNKAISDLKSSENILIKYQEEYWGLRIVYDKLLECYKKLGDLKNQAIYQRKLDNSDKSRSEELSNYSVENNSKSSKKYCYETNSGKYELTLFDDASKKTIYKLYNANGKLTKTMQGEWEKRDEGVYGTAHKIVVSWTGPNSSLPEMKLLCQYDGYGNLQALIDNQNRTWNQCY